MACLENSAPRVRLRFTELYQRLQFGSDCILNSSQLSGYPSLRYGYLFSVDVDKCFELDGYVEAKSLDIASLDVGGLRCCSANVVAFDAKKFARE